MIRVFGRKSSSRRIRHLRDSILVDLVRKLVSIRRRSPEVLRELLPEPLHPPEDALGELALPEVTLHGGGHGPPEFVAALRVDGDVAQDPELAGARRDV